MARSWIRAVFFLAGLVFLTRNAGEMTHAFERTFGLLFFAIFCLSHIERKLYERRRWQIVSGVLLMGIGLLLLRGEPVTDLSALSLMTIGLWFIVEGAGLPTRDFPPFAFTILTFTLLMLLGRTSGAAWAFVRWVSEAFSGVAALFGGESIVFRPAYSGMPVTGLMLVYWLYRWFFAERGRSGDLLWLAGLTIALQIAYLLFAAVWLESLLPYRNGLAEQPFGALRWYEGALVRSVPWNFPFLYFLLQIPVVLWGTDRLGRSADLTPLPLSSRSSLAFFQYGCAVLVLLIAIFSPRRPPAFVLEPVPTVAFDAWSYSAGGPVTASGSAALPRFIEALGVEARRVDTITTESLRGAQALVVANPDRPWDAGSTQTIWNFVRQGGSLLVLADHTPHTSGTEQPWVAEFLDESAIEIAFDAAAPAVRGWRNGYDFQWHRLTHGLRTPFNEPGIELGASLQLDRPAYPVILGRHGFEDAGNRYADDRGYLGNMQFDAGEPLGGAVLVAAEKYGKGKVLVFGDRATFDDANLPRTYPFVGAVFAWLIRPGGHRAMLLPSLFALLMLILFLYMVLSGFRPDRKLLLLWTAFTCVAATVATPQKERHDLTLPWSAESRLAFIDHAHLPRVSHEGWGSEGIDALQQTLAQSGLLVFRQKSGDLPAQADVAFVIAPVRRFSRREARALRGYVEAGGNLVLSIDRRDSKACRHLLETFGLEVLDRPLKSANAQSILVEGDVHFPSPWIVGSVEGPAEVLAAHEEHTLALAKRPGADGGAGQVVLIGDSRFFLDANREGAAAFTRALMRYLDVASEGSGQ